MILKAISITPKLVQKTKILNIKRLFTSTPLDDNLESKNHPNSPADLFQHRNLEISYTKEERTPSFTPEDLVFGKTHTDHMLKILFQNGKWEKPEIIPYGPIELHPFNTTLSAAITCYEGLKAYKGVDNVNIFRIFVCLGYICSDKKNILNNFE